MAGVDNKVKKGIKWSKAVTWIFFIIYLVFLIYALFFDENYGRTITNRSYNYNLILFKEIKRFYKYRHLLGGQAVFLNIFCNVIAFIPFGFFIPLLHEYKRSIVTVTLISFEISLTVEVMQLFFKVGSFDVDDLFLNTLGGLLGIILFTIITKIKKRR